jgi:hypothetical protein
MTILQYRAFTFNIIVVLTIVCVVLMGFLEYKNLFTAPDILVQQSLFDGINDRIIKTKGSLTNFETIYQAKNIQNFEATKNNLLVTTGIEDQESTLHLINIYTKAIKEFNYRDKFVGQILSSNDKFVMLVEDLKTIEGQNKRTYRSKIAILRDQNQEVEDFNPQFLASNARDIFINPSGNLLVFTGVTNSPYIVNFDNLQVVNSLDNLQSGKNLGFINDSQMHFLEYSANGDAKIKLVDVVAGQTSDILLNNPNIAQVTVSQNIQNIYYTQISSFKNSRLKGLKNYKTSAFKSDSNYSFENINIAPKDLFLLFEKTSPDSFPSSSNNYFYSKTKSFAIYNLKIQYLSSETVQGVKAIWIK